MTWQVLLKLQLAEVIQALSSNNYILHYPVDGTEQKEIGGNR